MGLRGIHSEQAPTRQRYPYEPLITEESLQAFRRFRNHVRKFGPGGPDFWKLNAALCATQGILEFPCVVPSDDHPLRWKGAGPWQAATIDRWIAFEKACSAQPKRRRKYKWVT